MSKHTWLKASLALVFLLSLTMTFSMAVQSSRLYQTPTPPLEAPVHIHCVAQENKSDKFATRWAGKAGDQTDYRVERQVDNGAWAEITTVPVGKDTVFQDDNTYTPTQVVRYRVRAHRDTDNSFGPYATCRVPVHFDSANFRLYYRPYPLDDSPPVEGRQTWTPDINNSNNQNEMAARIAVILEGSRAAFMRVGFADPASYDKGKPFPVNLSWCDGGGCANGGGIGLAPEYLGNYMSTTNSGDPSSIIVPIHELFHWVQFTYGGMGGDPNSNWVIEGQARSIQDKFCIGTVRETCISIDDEPQGLANYLAEVNFYLNNGVHQSSLPTMLEYQTALFWTYVTEKYGTCNEEPECGVDLLVKFWEEVKKDSGIDGITALNRALTTMGHNARFADVVKDFYVANYAKDLRGPSVPDKYKYIDETQPPGRYASVKLDMNEPLSANGQVGPTTADIRSWAARYYQVRPTADVPILNIEFRNDAPNTLYYTLLAIKNDDIALEINHTGPDFVRTFPNAGYDKVVVIVAGLENDGNFRYAFNASQPVLHIVDPINGRVAQAGDPSKPEKILVKVEVLSSLGAGAPVAGIDPQAFTVIVGSEVLPTANLIASAYIQGQYWLLIRPPNQSAVGHYDLSVRYTQAMIDTQVDAVHYTTAARSDADNVVIIDRSGSMQHPKDCNDNFTNLKMQAAKEAARLYVDSWRAGDQISIVSYNHEVALELGLTPWTTDSRNTALTKISALQADGNTTIGGALIKGMDELIASGNASNTWALILLSDGLNTANPPVAEFLKAYNERKGRKEQVPTVHTVALGGDADRPVMQEIARHTGGTYQYASEPFDPCLVAAGLTQATEVPQVTAFLELAEIYRAIGETVAHEQQIEAVTATTPDVGINQHILTVEVGAREAVFVVKYRGRRVCIIGLESVSDRCFDAAHATLYRPDGTAYGPPTISDFEHTLWRVPTPAAGNWIVTVEGVAITDDELTKRHEIPYLVEAAVKSDLTMEVFLGLAETERLVGNPMSILVTLADGQPIRQATVSARVTNPSGVVSVLELYDDGHHADGAAQDGFYGNTFYQTFAEGSYTVIATAQGSSPLTGNFRRRLRTAFHMAAAPDSDGDSIPDHTEITSGTDPNTPDAQNDLDQDGCITADELTRGLHPRDADSDDGGENDCSEATRGTDPLNPEDDTVDQPRAVAWPGVGRIWLRFTTPIGADHMHIYRSFDPVQGYTLHADNAQPTGEWIDGNLGNNTEYCYRLAAVGKDGSVSGLSNVTCATPKLDPNPPVGTVLINGGAPTTTNPDVQLTLWAADNQEPESQGPGSPPHSADAAVSSVIEMRLSNNGNFDNIAWEPYQTAKSWHLAMTDGLAFAYVEFRDAAGNLSRPVHNSIMVLKDTDNDSIADVVEGTGDTDGDGQLDYLDPDADNDTIPDAVEGMGDPDNDQTPNFQDQNSDNDQLSDAQEVGPDPMKPQDTNNNGTPDFLEVTPTSLPPIDEPSEPVNRVFLPMIER